MDALEARTVCIDIDHTICHSDGPGRYAEATCIDGAADAIRSLRAAGWIVVLFTARHFNHWATTQTWLAENDLEYDQLVFGKPPARYYVDDRAIPFTGDWRAVVEQLADAAPEG
jgi:hypothetical protein